MRKEIIESKIQTLVDAWEKANNDAWDVSGKPGPCFTASDMGDWDYIDERWREHHARIAADEAAAAKRFWAALSAAPAWLRLSRPWLQEAWERAFIYQQNGTYVGHACMPDIEEVYHRMGI